MGVTTIGNNGALPDEVENLIDRRLRLMRRQEEMRLSGVITAMDRAVVTHIRVGLDENKNRDAIALSTLAAYRDAAAKLLQVTEEWPDAVWKVIEPVLDCVSVAPGQGDVIAGLLYAHVWQPDDEPWMVRWLDAKRLAGLVQRVMGRYGLPATDVDSEFERQLPLESSKVRADFANRGRVALGEARAALDKYLLARCGDAAVAPAIPEADYAERVSAIARRTAIASHVEADGTRIEARQTDADGGGELTYIPYPKAMKMLRDSLGATPAELAVWVSFGDTPDCGGITAFLEASITDSPRILRFDCRSEADFDYIAPLMGAWFVLEDIVSFQPTTRYIEYSDLVERWRTSETILNVDSYISAKVREDRLHEVHPVSGFTELTWPDDGRVRPPKDQTLLDVAEVEAIETGDGIKPLLETRADMPAWREGGQENSAKPSFESASSSRVSRREQRKRETQEMYRDWEREYRELKQSRPGMSKRWYARQIARMDIARSRDAETIRRTLK